MLAAATLGCLLAGVSAVPQLRAGVALTTFDGAAATSQTWSAENDPVMGGRSESTFTVAGKLGQWMGEVKIVPSLHAPGFCTVRTQHDFPDISSTEGLLISARAHFPDISSHGGLSQLTSVKLTMESSVRLSPRQGEFEGHINLTDTMQEHFVPFASMTQSWRGQQEGGPPTARQLAKITGLGLNEDGVAGRFNFEIQSISAGSAPAPGPAPGPSPSPSPSKMLELAKFARDRSEGATWEAVNDPVMGGQSTGTFKVSGDHGVWVGDVKIVPKLKAPGFCRLQGEVRKTDVGEYDGLLFETNSAQGAPLSTVLAVIETRGLLPGRSGQWTAPIKLLGENLTAGVAFVAFENFRPFGIRPEKGKAPTKARPSLALSTPASLPSFLVLAWACLRRAGRRMGVLTASRVQSTCGGRLTPHFLCPQAWTPC